MAERCTIILSNPNGLHKSIYCHKYGIPSETGKYLKEYYKDPQIVEKLIGLGNISELGKTLETTKAYVRDFGENVNKNKAETFTDLTKAIDTAFNRDSADYVYVFRPKDRMWETHQRGKGYIKSENKSFKHQFDEIMEDLLK